MKQEKNLIAVSHGGWTGNWGENIQNEMALAASFYESDIDFLFLDAKRNTRQQINDIRKLVDMGVDVLIVFPNKADSLVDVITEVYQKGIYVIIADRPVATDQYSCYVGTDDEQLGHKAAEYILSKADRDIKVTEIRSNYASLASNQRSMGFHKLIRQNNQVSVDHILNGNWKVEQARLAMDSLLKTGYVPDYIFAHSDNMAQGAFFACERNNIRPVIIGIDGMPYPGGGLDMLINRQIDATFFNPSGGKEAVDLAIDFINGKKVAKEQILEPYLIDKSNAVALRRQNEILLEQQIRIHKQRTLIRDQELQLNEQRTHFWLSFILLMLFLIIALIAWRSLIQNRKHIRLIKHQKEQIEQHVAEQDLLMNQLKEKTQLLEVQKSIIEARHDNIYAQNQELLAYGSELEQLVAKRTAELRDALDKARESDRLKTAFLSNLSHEIRTPLNAIIGFSQLFFKPDRQMEERLELQRIIHKNTYELLTLINNIIELSQLTTGQIHLTSNSIMVSDIFRQIEDEVKMKLTENYWQLNNNVQLIQIAGDNAIVNGDSERIREVMNHLIENAIKHTHSGTIEYGWEVNAKNKKVKFFVRDTGIGIEDAFQKIIFEKFRKVESEDSLVLYRGAGMGLTICKHLAELMNTSIKLKSKTGEGSCFYFNLPY